MLIDLNICSLKKGRRRAFRYVLPSFQKLYFSKIGNKWLQIRKDLQGNLHKWVKVTQSCLTLFNPVDCSLWNSPSQNTGVGSLSLLQEIFPTQGSNPGLLQSGQIFYQLSHGEIPTNKEWFTRKSAWYAINNSENLDEICYVFRKFKSMKLI